MKDVKGGYQIVEIATGNTGMFAALEAAYNAKKPILVKKEGHSAFGNVTKDGNYFVANYIIDDVLHQDTISQLDAITDGSVDIGGADSEIQAIEERLNANKYVDRIDLLPYNSTNNKFTAPSDGYLWLRSVAGKVVDMAVELTGQGSTPTIIPISIAGTTISSDNAVFIKKGMLLYIRSNNDDTNSAWFYPIGN